MVSDYHMKIGRTLRITVGISVLVFLVSSASASTGTADMKTFTNSIGMDVDYKVYEKEGVSVLGKVGYHIVDWQGEKWVAINGNASKLAKLVMEMGKQDWKTLTTGETWSLGSGYELTINAIDARASPRQVWFTLKKDGTIVDEGIGQAPKSTTFADKEKAVYYKKKTILGESDALLFTVYVDSIDIGETSEMVQFRYAWLIDEATAMDIGTVTPLKTSPPACIKGYRQNAFYPGIDWEKKIEETIMSNVADDLDSTLIPSYMDTDAISGAFHVWLAYKGIPTEKNYLSNEMGDGYHPIVFAHSGGTQTLIKKIEAGSVTADYVVLAAPALLNQSQLSKLIKDRKIKKKIIIFQSKKDILYEINAKVERERKPSSAEIVLTYTDDNSWKIWPGVRLPGATFPAITVLSDIRISDIEINLPLLSELSLNGVVFDATSLLEKNSIDQNKVPNEELFWIGGANRVRQELFTNTNMDVNGDGEEDVIEIDMTQNFSGMSGGKVHQELLQEMRRRFVNGEYPFDERFEGLKKKGCQTPPIGSPEMLKLANRLTGFLKMIGNLIGMK